MKSNRNITIKNWAMHQGVQFLRPSKRYSIFMTKEYCECLCDCHVRFGRPKIMIFEIRPVGGQIGVIKLSSGFLSGNE